MMMVMMLDRMAHVVVSIMIILVLVGILRDAVPVMVTKSSNMSLHSNENPSPTNRMSTSFVWMTSSYSGSVYFVRLIIKTRGMNCKNKRLTNGDITCVDDDLKQFKD
jgi:hypothetical protein